MVEVPPPTSGHAAVDTANARAAAAAGDEANAADDPMQPVWRFYDSETELEQLLVWLDGRGRREKRLRAELDRVSRIMLVLYCYFLGAKPFVQRKAELVQDMNAFAREQEEEKSATQSADTGIPQW